MWVEEGNLRVNSSGGVGSQRSTEGRELYKGTTNLPAAKTQLEICMEIRDLYCNLKGATHIVIPMVS
eukprot:2894688-Rhodomonas_salina.1